MSLMCECVPRRFRPDLWSVGDDGVSDSVKGDITQVMNVTRLSIRWIAILIVGSVIVLLGIRRYQNEVSAVSVATFAGAPSDGLVRVVGRIAAGSVTLGKEGQLFDLAGEKAAIRVRYIGPENDDIRDLKMLVMIGRWDADGQVLVAERTALAPRIEFVVAAYFVGLAPLALFLFRMERKVEQLYTEIKEEVIYMPEKTR